MEIGPQGDIESILPSGDPVGCERLSGYAIPGVPNLHSHAHQRAMAGLAERSGASEDSFWTWRKVMYDHLSLMEPDDLEAIAAQLYIEMLKAGYTAVAEFQYLHHDPRGRAYETRAEMSLRTLAAAREAGIGITSLPVLYAHGGFGGKPPAPGQARFLNDIEDFLEIVSALSRESKEDPNAAVGIAPHSLRAVTPLLLGAAVDNFMHSYSGPIHIHVSEQVKEVHDCLAWSSLRPVEWLLNNLRVDERWCLIHATHLTTEETRGLAATGAVVGLCPTTEANLGDGLFNASVFERAGGRWGIGSDSHISLDPTEELRWLEYGQRLSRRRRTVLSGGPQRSTGRHLLSTALKGGAQACGRKLGTLVPGNRADIVVLDTEHPAAWERVGDEVLDTWVFAANTPMVKDVIVGGKTLVEAGRHRSEEAIARRFRKALSSLRSRL